jgi:two-component system KDP operon response regulator KdpE
VLLVEDEIDIVSPLVQALEREGYSVEHAVTGHEALTMVKDDEPDLVVLDLGLPDVDGLEVCRQLRESGFEGGVLMLTGRSRELDRVVGLDAGADDYLAKPFSVLELAARARAQLRRARTLAAAAAGTAPVSIGGLVVDILARKVSRDGTQLHLTPIEWQILATLLNAGGRTLTHQQIFDAVWDREFGSPQQYLRVHITNLRRKIETDPAAPQIIITEPGVGYRVELPR